MARTLTRKSPSGSGSRLHGRSMPRATTDTRIFCSKVSLMRGSVKEVVEFGVVPMDKGAALTLLRERLGIDSVLFVGDDVTDEKAFAALDPAAGDLSVKVGEGETLATQRVPDQVSVVHLLDLFVANRRNPETPQD